MKDRTRDPQRDKHNSLTRDCRNSYGESPHAARKAIPKRKRWVHRAARVAVKRDLDNYETMTPEQQDVAESSARNDTHSVGSWKKQPDAPLGRLVEVGQLQRQRDDGKITRDEYHDQVDDVIDKWHGR